MEIRNRILDVFKRQFNLSDLGHLGLSFEDLYVGALEEWDSLANLNLLLEIEKEFSVQFSTEELSSIQSLPDIEAYLIKQTIKKPA